MVTAQDHRQTCLPACESLEHATTGDHVDDDDDDDDDRVMDNVFQLNSVSTLPCETNFGKST